MSNFQDPNKPDEPSKQSKQEPLSQEDLNTIETAQQFLKDRQFEEAASEFCKIHKPLDAELISVQVNLAIKLSKQRRFDEAYILMEHIVKVYPKTAAKHALFRQEVEKVEKRKKISETILPDNTSGFCGCMVLLAIVAVVLLVIFGIYSIFTADPDVVLVNGLSTQAWVTINDDTLDIAPQSQVEICLALGEYPMKISMNNGFVELDTLVLKDEDDGIMFGVYLYNILDGAIIYMEEEIYTSDESNYDGPEAEFDLLFGKRLYHTKNPDYLFEKAPETVRAKKGYKIKSRIYQEEDPETGLLMLMLEGETDKEKELDYMEVQMEFGYISESFAHMYMSYLDDSIYHDRQKAFMESHPEYGAYWSESDSTKDLDF